MYQTLRCVLALFPPLRKKMFNDLEENNLMESAMIELAKFNDIKTLKH